MFSDAVAMRDMRDVVGLATRCLRYDSARVERFNLIYWQSERAIRSDSAQRGDE